MTGILRGPRRAALITITVLVVAASVASFSESFRGLFIWAHEHGLAGIWAAVWPLQVDVFIAVGELALFVALADGWTARSRIAAWTVTLAGLAVSVAGNVGHVAGHDLASKVTAAVPPLAAAAALAVGLGVLKRVVGAHHAKAETAQETVAEAVPEGDMYPPPGTTGETVAKSALEAALEPVTVPSAERAPGTVTSPTPQAAPRNRSPKRPAARSRKRPVPATGQRAETAFSDLLAEGELPSLRAIRRELHVGTPKAREILTHLQGVLGNRRTVAEEAA
jgi:hypothetical protein